MKAAAIAFALTTLGLCAAPAWADEDEAQEYANARISLEKAALTMDQAITAALKELPDGRAVEAELELEGGDAVYEVEILTGGKHMMVKLGATDGKIRGVEEEAAETEDEAEQEEEQAEAEAAIANLTLSQALAAVLAQAPGAKVFEANALRQEDRLLFEFEFLSADNRVMHAAVDAASGEVLKFERERE